MFFQTIGNGFVIKEQDELLLAHSIEQPMVYLGKGQELVKMFRGNFTIRDEWEAKIPLPLFTPLVIQENFIQIRLHNISLDKAFLLTVERKDDYYQLRGEALGTGSNRLWLCLPADSDERVYGGGEQFSYFNLRGKRFPIWTSEQGVGRNKNSYVTFMADSTEGAGGDYYTTFFPEATFISSRRYYCHIENTCYAELDFSHEAFHQVLLWEDTISFRMAFAPSLQETLVSLTKTLGRQELLPDWCMEGIWLGIQGGTALCREKIAAAKAQGMEISGIWCQDWVGIKTTSFGKRLHWNWQHDEKLYPGLKEQIQEWKQEGIHFLGYINPYLLAEESLFNQAESLGFLVKNQRGETYRVDCGEFDSGIVDLTNPAAFTWYKEVIKGNMIDFGLAGWMADFGEYLPTDAVLFQGEAKQMHNLWPVLWAKVNYEAIAEKNGLGKYISFHRSGGPGSQKYALAMWAGDQNVDWSLDDGLISVVVAALSMGMTGHGIHTSDIGGYTSLFGMKRSKKLLLRWAEFCIFTPILRSHEGNRPYDCWQFDSDQETLAMVAWCSRVHSQLLPYMKTLAQENSQKGLPIMRPLVLHYEDDPHTYDLKYQYLLGADLMVAPCYEEDMDIVSVYLPEGSWRQCWTGATYESGHYQIEAPLGRPAVFYKADSWAADIFCGLEPCP